MMLACAALFVALQDPQADPVLASEARRAAVIERCAPAVCSVMSMDQPGGGSGVIFHPAGFVLTNYHVVGSPDDNYKPPPAPSPAWDDLEAFHAANPDADEAAVERFRSAWQAAWIAEHHPRGKTHYKLKKIGLPDGELYAAEVLGIDPGSDLAVLRLLPREPDQTWPWCPLGDSDQVLVGQTVFAMGNPFLLATDFTPTVTFGIVSGTHRYQEGQGNRMLVYPDCIQVDAPVNPGNSGGPLFNEAGEVIGINGRISVGERGRVNVGVGFAISSNQIRNFLGDLLAGRHAEHGTLDMSAWFMNSGTGEAQRRGVFVQQMFRDSVIAAAGIGLGDEITWFHGTEVRSANQLATLVGVLPAGTLVTVGYRPKLGDETFGEERRVVVRLTTLDTGSSRDGTGDSARLASRHNRRLAAAAIVAQWQPPTDAPAAVAWTITDGSGQQHRAFSDGQRLRLELGALTLVQASADDCFAIDGGTVRPATADERARLERELRCNPLLWPQQQWSARLQHADLVGGINVHGRAAYRFALPGDGDCEAFLTTDGQPAGCRFRDPVRRATVEWHVGERHLRLLLDDAVQPGWSQASHASGPTDETWFRRP
jgi:S1-C subfamily serine protease